MATWKFWQPAGCRAGPPRTSFKGPSRAGNRRAGPPPEWPARRSGGGRWARGAGVRKNGRMKTAGVAGRRLRAPWAGGTICRCPALRRGPSSSPPSICLCPDGRPSTISADVTVLGKRREPVLGDIARLIEDPHALERRIHAPKNWGHDGPRGPSTFLAIPSGRDVQPHVSQVRLSTAPSAVILHTT